LEAIRYSKMASESAPEEPKYAYTYAFYLMQNNQKTEAIKTLETLIKAHPQYLTAVSLLADIYVKDGKTKQALNVYRQALKADGISNQDRVSIQQAIAALQRGV
jgi:predicted Zn-dependent protease